VLDANVPERADGSEGALRIRSALLQAKHIHAATLLLNGADDDRTDPAQARMLDERIRLNDVYARAITYPGLGHAIEYELREREIRPFLQTHLASVSKSPFSGPWKLQQ
jgi:dipeptidyl aminopeptidase/acylaminoacyl peptidase